MADFFEEYLQQKRGIQSAQRREITPQRQRINPFLEEFSAMITEQEPQAKVPFIEKKGLIQQIFKAPIELGKDIAFLLDRKFIQESIKREEEMRRIMAEKLKSSDLPDRTKQVLANILSESSPFDNVYEPKTKSQIIGDILGTVLFVVPIGTVGTGLRTLAATKGIPMTSKLLKLGDIAIAGAKVGASFGVAESLSEKEDTAGFLKNVAIGAGVGGISNVVLSGLGLGLRSGIKKIKTTFPNVFSNIHTEEAANFFTSLGARLRKDFGEEGREIAERFLTADRKALLRTGKAFQELKDAGFFKLTEEQSLKLADALEGRIKEVPKEIKKSFDVIDRLRQEIAKEAQSLGVRTRLKRGVDYPFQPKENYFPHIVPSEENLMKGKIREKIINNAVRIGKFKTKEEAEKVLDSYLNFVKTDGKKGGDFWINYLINTGQAKTKDEAVGKTLRFFKASRINRFGSLEKAREIDFPFYELDARKAIPTYLMGALKRLEEIKQFGHKLEIIDSLVGKVRRIKGVEAAQELRLIIKTLTGAIEKSPNKEAFVQWLRTLQIPKLSFAQILNIGQNLNTLLSTDAPTFLKSIVWSFREEGKRNALRSGAVLEEIIRETRKIAGGDLNFAEEFLRLTGFSSVERINRTIAANSGIIYSSKILKKLIKNPNNQVLRERLSELGINPDLALKRGYLTDDELLMAGQILSEKTQFRNRPIDLPQFAQSPEGKLFIQFKTFAFHQSRFLVERLKNQIRNNNYGGLARDLIILGTIFPLTGEVLADIRSLVAGEKRKTPFLQRYFENLITVGGIGILSDVLQASQWGKLAEFILGPAVSSITEAIERVVRAAERGEVKEGDIKFLLRQTGFGRSIANYLYPNDKENQKTFLETLEEVFSSN